MTKEDILLILDNNIDTEEYLKLKESVKSDPKIREIVQEIRDETPISKPGQLAKTIFDIVKLTMSDNTTSDDKKFIIINSLNSIAKIDGGLSNENKEELITMINDFILNSSLEEDKVKKLELILEDLK